MKKEGIDADKRIMSKIRRPDAAKKKHVILSNSERT